MQILRTIMWVIVAIIVFGFVSMNWGSLHEVKIWPGETNGIVFDWPVGFIALVFFLLGFVPLWLFHRGVKWRLNRRVQSLENTARTAATIPVVTREEMDSSDAEVPAPPSAEQVSAASEPEAQDEALSPLPSSDEAPSLQSPNTQDNEDLPKP